MTGVDPRFHSVIGSAVSKLSTISKKIAKKVSIQTIPGKQIRIRRDNCISTQQADVVVIGQFKHQT